MRLLVTTGALVLTVAVAAAVGAIPAPDGTLTACYATSGGLLRAEGAARLVDDEGDCRSFEDAVSWNQEGPKGDPGATGATGATGPSGPTGATGPGGEDGEDGQDGADGEDGQNGPAGPAGPAGPSGTSAAFVAHTGANEIDVAGGPQLILSKQLPAGNYLVSASVDAYNPSFADDPYFSCEIPGVYKSERVHLGLLADDPDEGSDAFSLSLSGTLRTGGGRVDLFCDADDGPARVGEATLTSLKVDTIG